MGYGFVKICCQNGTYTYPALVDPLDPGGIPRHLHHPDDIIEYDGNHYLVGQTATRAPFRFRELWDTWWTSPTYQVLLTKAARALYEKRLRPVEYRNVLSALLQDLET